MKWYMLPVAVLLLGPLSLNAQQDNMQEMPVFTSSRATASLDLLMVAKPKRIELAGTHPVAWVYEICPLSAAKTIVARQIPGLHHLTVVCVCSCSRAITFAYA
jgi:hypothetical protein